MTEFRYMRGTVYILENLKAQRVKVGMTVNDVALRLKDVNDMWFRLKLTCQICGRRRLAKVNWRKPRVLPRLMPRHIVSGVRCPGGDALPLESDIELAKAHVENLRTRVARATGSERGSLVRQIDTLGERIRLRGQQGDPVGKWRINTVYYTDCAEQVELLAHKVLAEHLDRTAPFGEVFDCSISQAQAAIEKTLEELSLRGQATRKDYPHESHAA